MEAPARSGPPPEGDAPSCEALAAGLPADALRRLLDAPELDPRLGRRMQASPAGRRLLARALADRLGAAPGWVLPEGRAARILATGTPDALGDLMRWAVAFRLAPGLRRTVARADLQPALDWMGEARLRAALATGPSPLPADPLPREPEAFEALGRALLAAWAEQDPALSRLALLLHPDLFDGEAQGVPDPALAEIVDRAAEACDDRA